MGTIKCLNATAFVLYRFHHDPMKRSRYQRGPHQTALTRQPLCCTVFTIVSSFSPKPSLPRLQNPPQRQSLGTPSLDTLQSIIKTRLSIMTSRPTPFYHRDDKAANSNKSSMQTLHPCNHSASAGSHRHCKPAAPCCGLITHDKESRSSVVEGTFQRTTRTRP